MRSALIFMLALYVSLERTAQAFDVFSSFFSSFLVVSESSEAVSSFSASSKLCVSGSFGLPRNKLDKSARPDTAQPTDTIIR